MENGTVTISITRFEELIRKEAAFELNRIQLMGNKYAHEWERVVFNAPYQPPEEPDEPYQVDELDDL